jgi:putative tributyrin esterase
MALAELRYFSTALRKMTGATVLLPEREDFSGPFPVFYLLHGLSDDYTAWTRKSRIEQHVHDYPLIVVMPDGGRGFYTDAREGYAYDAAITRDLVALVDRTFHTDARRAARAIGGLSMGGYGALRLALRHPDLFCSAVSHSGALGVAGQRFDPAEPLPDKLKAVFDEGFIEELRRLFGENPSGGPDDLFAIAETVDRVKLPDLRFDCGTDDDLLEENRAFHRLLEKLAIPHEYAEFPGGHTWEYWDLHVQEALAFHTRNLGIQAQPPMRP